jgi:hypothetical protein
MRRFDEVMIVNPYDPSVDGEGEKVMLGHYGNWSGLGYYADPYAYADDPSAYAGSYGYGYGDPYAYGYGYADPYGYGDPYGYANAYGYAQPYYGYGMQPPGYGYAYGPEPSELQDSEADPFGDYAQDDPSMSAVPDEAFDGYGCSCGGRGGYGQDDGYGQNVPPPDDFADGDPNGYADPYGYSGYVPDAPSRFNAGCPMPVNAGLSDDESMNGYEGYVPTANVNASCAGFRQGPRSSRDVPDTFRPLW